MSLVQQEHKTVRTAGDTSGSGGTGKEPPAPLRALNDGETQRPQAEMVHMPTVSAAQHT